MKSGETILVTAEDLLTPLVGTLVEMEYDGEPIKARITDVFPTGARVTVVPKSTKE